MPAFISAVCLFEYRLNYTFLLQIAVPIFMHILLMKPFTLSLSHSMGWTKSTDSGRRLKDS